MRFIVQIYIGFYDDSVTSRHSWRVPDKVDSQIPEWSYLSKYLIKKEIDGVGGGSETPQDGNVGVIGHLEVRG